MIESYGAGDRSLGKIKSMMKCFFKKIFYNDGLAMYVYLCGE